jgi:hypothetical protein
MQRLQQQRGGLNSKGMIMPRVQQQQTGVRLERCNSSPSALIARRGFVCCAGFDTGCLDIDTAMHDMLS